MLLTTAQKLIILRSNKDFICYNVNKNNKVIDYVITNDLKRYYNKDFKHFKCITDIQKHILNEKFNYSFKDILIDLKLL